MYRPEYKCPICNEICERKLEVHCEYFIDIRKIVLEHGERLNWNTFEMFQLIVEEDREHNNGPMQICYLECCEEMREKKYAKTRKKMKKT